ncbi:MAG: hypothetical protein JSR09_03855 [Bacteroidetes bacterium]|nr:hypothetical protein [Bacteroidota bacterium]
MKYSIILLFCLTQIAKVHAQDSITRVISSSNGFSIPKGYEGELALVNKLLAEQKQANCLSISVKGTKILFNRENMSPLTVDVRQLAPAISEGGKNLRINTLEDKKAIDMGDGKFSSSFIIKKTVNSSTAYYTLASMFNMLAEVIRYTTYTDVEWEAYIKRTTPSNDYEWKPALKALNEQLITSLGTGFGYFATMGKYIYLVNADNTPHAKFNIEDSLYAFVEKYNLSTKDQVVLNTDSAEYNSKRQQPIFREQYYFPTYSYLFKNYQGSIELYGVKQEDKKDLVNKLNNFVFAYLGTKVPDVLVIKEKVKTEAETWRQNAHTPLEKAFTELKIFLSDKPYDGTYFNTPILNGSSLSLDQLNNKITVLLDRVGAMTIENVDMEKPTIKIMSSSKGYFLNYNGSFYENHTYSSFNNKDAKLFYKLMGDVLDAYLEENKIKQRISYADKYKIITNPSFIENIPRGSTVKIIGNTDNTKEGKPVRKLIGEIVTSQDLSINNDLDGYVGKFTTKDGKTVYGTGVQIEFISNEDGENIAETKAADRRKKILEEEIEAKYQKNLKQGLKFVHQFIKASDEGSYKQFISFGTKSVELSTSEYDVFILKLPETPVYITQVELVITKNNRNALVRLVFDFLPDAKKVMNEIYEYKKAGFVSMKHKEVEVTENGQRVKGFFVNDKKIFMFYPEPKKYNPYLQIYEYKDISK